MKYYRFPENRLWKAAFLLFFFAMLYLARDTLTTSAILGFYKAQFLMLGILAAAGVLFLWYNRRDLKSIFLDIRVILFGLGALPLMLSMVFKGDWQMMYLSVMICLFFGVFLSYFLTLREAAKCYVGILAVLGVYTVIATYLFRILPDREILTVPIVYNQRGTSFYYFFPTFVSMFYVKNRNFGIFREPGVYQYFLILALMLNNYAVDWKKESSRWLCNAALAVTMVSTLATGGILELGLLAVILFFDKKLYRKKLAWAIVLSGTAVVGLVAAWCIKEQNDLYWEFYDLLIGKFVTRQLSFTERTEAILVNLNVIAQHPIVGGRIADVLHAIENNTSSSLIMFSCYGLGGGLLHVLGWLALCWNRERKLWVNLGLTLMMFLSFNTQNLTADTFFWLFPTMAMAELLGPKLARRA